VDRLRVQLGAQFVMVIDLAVVGDDVALIGRKHRLVTGGREIDDREPQVAEGYAVF
jgi:hypothetical protein